MVEASLVNFAELGVLTVGVVIALQQLRDIKKTREVELETRQAQLFLNIYNQSFTNPQFVKSYRKVFDAEWNNYDEFKVLYNSEDDVFRFAYDYVGSILEGVGVLVRESLIPIRFIVLMMNNVTRGYWEKTRTIISEWREDYSSPRIWSEIEYLYTELMKYLEEHPELAP